MHINLGPDNNRTIHIHQNNNSIKNNKDFYQIIQLNVIKIDSVIRLVVI